MRIKLRFSKLNDYEKNVLLAVDEIYVAKRPEFSGGQINGVSNEFNTARTALCFMVKSLCSKYRDIVGIFPVKFLTSDKLFESFNHVMTMLHNIGFLVRAVLVDNSHPNRRFFVFHLCHGELKPYIISQWTQEKLFLLFDPTHNVKNIYSNFQKRRIYDCPSMPKHFDNAVANFSDLEEVYDTECDRPLRLAHKLSKVVLYPKSIEKSSVKMTVAILHESTIHALRYFGYTETASVLDLFAKVWKIMNVKTTTIGFHKRDYARDAVTSSNDWKLKFLEDFACFLERWQQSKKRGLTADTFLANIQTCRALPEMARFLISTCGFRYVLLGNIQSDCIEGRFGWIRQLSGANYYISVRQLLESCNKIKAISLLKFSQISIKELSAAAYRNTNEIESVTATLALDIQNA